MPRVVPSQVVTLIDELFPFAATQEDQPQAHQTLHVGHATQVAAVVSLVEQVPAELIVLDPRQYAALVTSMAAMRNALETWRGPRALNLTYIAGFGNLNPVTLVRRALALCPDEVITAGTSELAFISDAKLRDDLRMDTSSVRTAVINGEWKAATVLAGSVVEALLLWALQSRSDVSTSVAKLVGQKILPRDPTLDLERWDLHDFIEVAADLRVIKEETAQEARLVKDYRNLIHPGRVARLRQKCDRGTAYFAVAALDHVIRDITP